MSRSVNKPRLILTLGDPNGIGPEIILKIFNNKKFVENLDLTVAGLSKILNEYADILNLNRIPPEKIIEISIPGKFKLSPGKIDKLAGKISGDSISAACALCMKEKFSGMITLPISKEALNKGGYDFPGHTEMLTEMTGSKNTAMILYSKKFSTAPVTGHIPLSEVSKSLSKELLFNKIVTVNNSLVKDFKIKNPKIAVLGLNPHAGDGGLIGQEEKKLITPLITKMNSMGFNIRGPYPSDGFFASGHYKNFDITMALYHDQGLIPFKMISFDEGVNFTAGLKTRRASPDHGTAFDIAGAGRANPESTMQAILLLDEMH